MGSTHTAGRISKRGGVPAALPPADAVADGQLALSLAGGRPRLRPLEDRIRRPLPDVVRIADWLTFDEQRELVARFREWSLPPAGLRQPRVPSGHLMTVQAVCLGWHWYPYAYSRTADDTDGAPVKPLPTEIVELARRAVHDTGFDAARFAPDAAIVNFYPPGARLGLHQDGEEPSDAPVVTISLGDSCVFRMAGTDRRTGPFTDVLLASGDLLVFGGRNRRIFHGVPAVVDTSAPGGLALPPGRLSITVRETGFE
jgi:alkylated DNA repair protein (DNA oxidative demethylase)